MRQTQSRTPYRSDLDSALERRGKMSDITAADRAAIVRTAELLGCQIAAEHILADAHRRRLVVAAPEPAPRPGPRPRQTAPTPPLLRLIVNEGEMAVHVDDRASFYLRMALLVEEAVEADWADLSERAESAAYARELRAAAFEHLAVPDEEPPSPSAA